MANALSRDSAPLPAPMPDSQPKLERFFATPIFENHVAAFLAQPLPTQVNPVWGFERERVPASVQLILKVAHAFTEMTYGMRDLAPVSKKFQEKRLLLRTKVVEQIRQIHEGSADSVRGSTTLKELVDSGCYLRALRIYFFVKPEALRNSAGDPARQDVHRRTILHNAARPYGAYTQSESFLKFVLEMDQRHRLGLSSQQDCAHKTPLEWVHDVLTVPALLKDREKESLERAQTLLEQHENIIRFVSRNPFFSRFLATPLFAKHVAPFLAIAQPRRVYELCGFNDGWVSPENVQQLETAHRLTEQIYGLEAAAKCCKAFKDARRKLLLQVADQITQVHEKQNSYLERGAMVIRELVDSGCYLRALRIYFFVKPTALNNYASDPERQESDEGRTILHNAVLPSGMSKVVSEPFIRFVLAMDLQHKLALSRQPNSEGLTPLDTTQICLERDTRFYGDRNPEEIASLTRRVTLLVAHEEALERAYPHPLARPAPEVKEEKRRPAAAPGANGNAAAAAVQAPVLKPASPAAREMMRPKPQVRAGETAVPSPSFSIASLCSSFYAYLSSALVYLQSAVDWVVTKIRS